MAAYQGGAFPYGIDKVCGGGVSDSTGPDVSSGMARPSVRPPLSHPLLTTTPTHSQSQSTQAGSHATDAATNTEDTLTLGPAPSPCSSSSSLASLLLTQEGGRAGGPPTAPGAGLTPPPVGVGAGKVGMRTRAAPEESVPSSEIDLLLVRSFVCLSIWGA